MTERKSPVCDCKDLGDDAYDVCTGCRTKSKAVCPYKQEFHFFKGEEHPTRVFCRACMPKEDLIARIKQDIAPPPLATSLRTWAAAHAETDLSTNTNRKALVDSFLEFLKPCEPQYIALALHVRGVYIGKLHVQADGNEAAVVDVFRRSLTDESWAGVNVGFSFFNDENDVDALCEEANMHQKLKGTFACPSHFGDLVNLHLRKRRDK